MQSVSLRFAVCTRSFVLYDGKKRADAAPGRRSSWDRASTTHINSLVSHPSRLGPANTASSFLHSRPLRLGVLLVLVAGGLGLSLWLGTTTPPPAAKENPRIQDSSGDADSHRRDTEPEDNFLASFQKAEAEPIGEGSAAANAELEKQFQEVASPFEKLMALRRQFRATDEHNKAELLASKHELVRQLDVSLPRLQKALAAARKARPRDPVPAWLTGELLALIGGEPALVLPYLEQAVAGKLDRAHLFATLAHVYHASNQFQKAHDAAVHAVEIDRAAREAGTPSLKPPSP